MPAQDFRLATDACHVWTLSLKQPAGVLERLQQSLSQDELQRARRYRYARQLRQFILTRGALRELLGCYLDKAPAQCCITLSESGKPFVAASTSDGRSDAVHAGGHGFAHSGEIFFNVAHAGDQAIIAIARGIEVGVDIEAHRVLDERQALTDMILSPTEKERWEALPEETRTCAFYALWTRKEAVAKAIGQGLLMELNTLGVSFEQGLPPRLLEIPVMYGRPQDWTLVALEAATGYTAALAAPVREIRITQKTWQPQELPLH